MINHPIFPIDLFQDRNIFQPVTLLDHPGARCTVSIPLIPALSPCEYHPVKAPVYQIITDRQSRLITDSIIPCIKHVITFVMPEYKWNIHSLLVKRSRLSGTGHHCPAVFIRCPISFYIPCNVHFPPLLSSCLLLLRLRLQSSPIHIPSKLTLDPIFLYIIILTVNHPDKNRTLFRLRSNIVKSERPEVYELIRQSAFKNSSQSL